MHKRFAKIFSIGILGLSLLGLVFAQSAAPSVNIINEVRSETECKFTIQIRFSAVEAVLGAPLAGPSFCSPSTRPLQVGTPEYTFDCTITETTEINLMVYPNIVKVGDNGNEEILNTGYPFKQSVECDLTTPDTSGVATENDQEPGTTAGSAVVCPSVCEAREYCLDGKCECNPKIANQFDKCCGIELLTNVPFIGKCITLVSKAKQDKMPGVVDKDTLIVSEEEAFPRLMLGLTKILVTVILLASFIAIIVAGVMIAASGSSDTSASKGRQIIGGVVAALALLGASGVILRLINPNFFG